MKVEKQVNEAMNWMNSKMNEESKQSLTVAPAIKACEILSKTKVLITFLFLKWFILFLLEEKIEFEEDVNRFPLYSLQESPSIRVKRKNFALMFSLFCIFIYSACGLSPTLLAVVNQTLVIWTSCFERKCIKGRMSHDNIFCLIRFVLYFLNIECSL